MNTVPLSHSFITKPLKGIRPNSKLMFVVVKILVSKAGEELSFFIRKVYFLIKSLSVLKKSNIHGISITRNIKMNIT